jgi:hypothetical protein
VLAVATDPDTPLAGVTETVVTVPVNAGRSATTSARNKEAAADPDTGPAKTVFAVWALIVAPTVPVEVTGTLGVALSTTPSPLKVTLATVPPPPLPPPLLLFTTQ